MSVRVLADGRTIHTLKTIPGGTPGTRATLYTMRDIVRTWRKHPQVRALALQVTRQCEPKNWACYVYRIQEWVQGNIRYVRDVTDVETLQTPDVTLRDRAGDCDDHSILVASLLQSIGHRVRFLAVGFRTLGPFAHVFTETHLGPYWRSVETTELKPVGWYPPGIKRRMIVKI